MPILAAGLLYFSGYTPSAGVNHGELVAPPRSLPGLRFIGLQPRSPAPSVWEGRWSLVWLVEPPCGERCHTRLDEMLRIQLGLRKGALRVQRVLIIKGLAAGAEVTDSLRSYRDLIALVPEDEKALNALLRTFDPPAHAASGLYVVDPGGRLVLRYRPEVAARDVIDDLKRLLRYSWIG